jgi:4-hydroxy-tetrahydrodipicolinate synthase
LKIEGVVVPLATPLTRDRAPDLAALGRLIAHLLNAGVHGIFANGSMGAFALMSDAKQCAVVEAAAGHVANRVPVLAGISDTGLDRVIEKVRNFAGLGVDAFVATPPFYYICEQKELLRFFLALADAAPKPLILYDNPRLAKNVLAVETIVRLAQHPNICGIKISHPDVLVWQDLLRAPVDRGRFALISGAGRMTSLALQLGFDGITEGLHNIVPSLAVDLYAAQKAGNFVEGDCIQRRINRCFGVFEVAGGWRGLEVSLQALGIANFAAPFPYDEPPSEDARRRILEILAAEEIVRP